MSALSIKSPAIPFVERIAIIESVKYVDRLVSVDFSSTKKIDAWNKYHFGCDLLEIIMI